MNLKLKTISTDDLIAELTARGYYATNLWQIEDVTRNLNDINEDRENPLILDDIDKMDILETVFSSDRIGTEINEAITETINNEYLD